MWKIGEYELCVYFLRLRSMSLYYYVRLLGVLTVITVVLSCVFLLREPASLPSSAPLLAENIYQISTQERDSVQGYHRSFFGSWDTPEGSSCSIRVLIIYGDCDYDEEEKIYDPYSGKTVVAKNMEVDHIFPLRAAWDMGAHSWSRRKMYAFANDPLNLVAVSRAENQAKKDMLPSQWLPSHPQSRCWYVRKVAHIAVLYELSLTEEDIQRMRSQCFVKEIFEKIL